MVRTTLTTLLRDTDRRPARSNRETAVSSTPSSNYTNAQHIRTIHISAVVNRHWARLLLGWVTVCGLVNHLGM